MSNSKGLEIDFPEFDVPSDTDSNNTNLEPQQFQVNTHLVNTVMQLNQSSKSTGQSDFVQCNQNVNDTSNENKLNDFSLNASATDKFLHKIDKKGTNVDETNFEPCRKRNYPFDSDKIGNNLQAATASATRGPPPARIGFHTFLPRAVAPMLPTNRASTYNVLSCEYIDVLPNQIVAVSTGIALQFPQNIYGKLHPHYSLAARGVTTIPTIIENDFAGHVKVLLHNTLGDNTFKVKPGLIIARMSFERAIDCHLIVGSQRQHMSLPPPPSATQSSYRR